MLRTREGDKIKKKCKTVWLFRVSLLCLVSTRLAINREKINTSAEKKVGTVIKDRSREKNFSLNLCVFFWRLEVSLAPKVEELDWWLFTVRDECVMRASDASVRPCEMKCNHPLTSHTAQATYIIPTIYWVIEEWNLFACALKWSHAAASFALPFCAYGFLYWLQCSLVLLRSTLNFEYRFEHYFYDV